MKKNAQMKTTDQIPELNEQVSILGQHQSLHGGHLK